MKQLSDIAALVLAAGSASRMGSSKQLLKVNGLTLLEHTVACARTASLKNIRVVLGANADEIQSALPGLDATVLVCPTWHLGMGSSLKYGLRNIIEYQNPKAVLVLVCDQPMLTAAHLTQLANHFLKGHADGVGSQYAGRLGVPAIFNASIFDQLLGLDDQHGAGKLLNGGGLNIPGILFPGGAFDLDTPEDYKKFLEGQPKD